MPVTDDLQRIAEQADRELTAVHDFFEYSKIIWRSFQLLLVEQGHRISAENMVTGTKIDQDGLVRLAPQYTREYLATFTFRQFVSVFESFLFNFLHRLLLHNPWPFARCSLDFELVLKAVDKEEIVSDFLHKQLNELKYGTLREWFLAIDKTVKLECPSPDEIDTLAEIKATRDILEHNAGVVNDIYVRKAGKKGRYASGDRVEIEDGYHLDSWRLIRKVVAEITAAGLARLAK